MEPYRVDRDLGSTIPVDTLHQEIRSAAICIADITTRNPSVMYELGYAIAAGKDVVIISGPSSGPNSEKYPFDIQHRGIISYSVGSISDFKELGQKLTSKLNAILARQEKTSEIVSASPIKDSDGLQPHELTALALILANTDALDDTVNARYLKGEMHKAGYSEVGTRLALAKLVKTGYVSTKWMGDREENWVVYGVTELGEQWLLENQSKLELQTRKTPKKEEYVPEISNDDIPF